MLKILTTKVIHQIEDLMRSERPILEKKLGDKDE